MAVNPPAGHDPQAQRAQAGGWFRQHWKEVLAVAVAVIPVAAYFLLRGQASGQGVSNALPSGSVLAGGSSAGDTSTTTPPTPTVPANCVFPVPFPPIVPTTAPAPFAGWTTGGAAPGVPGVGRPGFIEGEQLGPASPAVSLKAPATVFSAF